MIGEDTFRQTMRDYADAVEEREAISVQLGQTKARADALAEAAELVLNQGDDGGYTESAAIGLQEAINAYKEGRAAHPDGWRPIETAPRDGSHIVGRTSNTYRWKKYKPGAPAWAIAAGGRWQKANEHGGWDNCDPDFTEWRPSPPVKEGE